jgi:hypothetical protein
LDYTRFISHFVANLDYHEDTNMSGNLFYNWFKDTLLSNIEPNSVIVLDNASYHSVMSEKIPNSNSKYWDGAESKTPPSNLPDTVTVPFYISHS